MSGYNLLVLDDDQDRLVAFRRALTNGLGNDLTLVSTASDAISMLKLYTYAIVFLDYDLDLQQSLNAAVTGNGMDVVDWIAQIVVRTSHTRLRRQITQPDPTAFDPPPSTAAGLQALLKPGVWTDKAFLSAL